MLLTEDPDFVAARQAAQGYNRSTLVLMGDSRLAGAFNDPSAKLLRHGASFITHGFKLSGQRMKVEKSFAVSGQRSDQYLAEANVIAALACKSYWLMVYGILNDIAQLGGATDYWNVTVRPVVERWLATGRAVILLTETGSGGLTTAAQKGAVFKYNRQIRDYARANRNVILFDVAAIVMQPGAEMTINPAYSGDATHINLAAGAYAVGTKFADLIKQIAPPCEGLVYSTGQVFANGGVQLFANPLFTTTDTAAVGIMTGTKPTGITAATGPAGSSIVSSVAAGAYGNDWQLAITAGAGGLVKVISDFSSIEIVGESYFANCEFDISAGHSNFQSAAVHLECARGGVTTPTEDGFMTTANGNLPAGAYTLVSETEYITVPSGTRNWFSAGLYFYFSAAGTATVKVRRLGVWRVTP